MKKLFLVLAFSFPALFVLAQGSYGSWYSVRTNSCSQNLKYKYTIEKVDNSTYGNKTKWNVTFKSDFSQRIHFSYQIYMNGQKIDEGRTSVKAGGIGGYGANGYSKYDSSTLEVHISKVVLGERDTWGKYWECSEVARAYQPPRN